MNKVYIENIKSIFIENLAILDISGIVKFLITGSIFFVLVVSDTIREIRSYMKFKKNQLYKQGDLIKEKNIDIYRIEDQYGVGPYQTRVYDYDLIKREESEATPTPYTDMEDIWNYLEYTNIRREFFFGFTSMEQLYNWFSEDELELLEEYGFDVNVYQSNIYYKTDKQVIFKKTA